LVEEKLAPPPATGFQWMEAVPPFLGLHIATTTTTTTPTIKVAESKMGFRSQCHGSK